MTRRNAVLAAVAIVLVAVTAVVIAINLGGNDGPGQAEADAEVEQPAPTDTQQDEQPEPESDDDPEEPAETETEPTPAEIQGAALLFPWPVEATKTATLIPPPAGIEPVAVGTSYPVPLDVIGACNNTTGECSEMVSEPHFTMFGWTPSEPLMGVAWTQSGGSWSNQIVGYYVSAEYGSTAKCVYEWKEIWDITITDAVHDGEVWFATAFEGTMVTSSTFSPDHSEGRIADYCPEYAASDEWEVKAERPLVTSGG